MAYTPYTPVGSNLSDLGRLLEAGEARSAAENMQRMSLMFQNAQKKADLESRRAENEADRKLKYFEVDQRKALQTRSLDMEDSRLKAEAERWFAGHGLKEREVSAYEKQLNAPDPRVARENAITIANRQELNSFAKRAAAAAQQQLDAITTKLGTVPDVGAGGGIREFFKQGYAPEKRAVMFQERKRKAQIAQNVELATLREALAKQFGEAASLVDFVPDGEVGGLINFKAIAREITDEGTGQPPQARPEVQAQQFFGPQRPSQFTLIPEGYPAQPAMQFPTREALDAFSGRGTNAAPVLRYNPQTGTFE